MSVEKGPPSIVLAAATVDFDRPAPLGPIPVVYGYAGILLSVCFFQSLNQIVLRLVGCPKTVGRENVWKWRNLVVSWTHALIVGVWDLTCFFWYPELVSDLISYHNFYIYSMVAFSTGYFLHDLIDIVVNKQSSSMWEVIPHHVAITTMFIANLVHCHCIAYSVIALLAEVNTVFLHSRKLLQMAGVAFDRPLYRANAALNLATFVTCRFVCLVWIGYGIICWRELVGRFYIIAAWLAMIVMCPINAVLFWRLLCSDVLGWRRSRSKPASNSVGATSTAYRIISDGTIPVSVEDMRLTCCPPTDVVSCVGRHHSGLKEDGGVVAAVTGSKFFKDAREQISNSIHGSTGIIFSECHHRRIPIDDLIGMGMPGFQR